MSIRRAPLLGHPGSYIKQSVLPAGLSVTAAAKTLGIGRPALSNLLNGNASLSSEMATRIEAVRALLGRAARAVDENAPDADTLCNMVKLFASEEILKVTQHAVELHGGNGMMLDFGVEKLFRDAAIFLHMDATVDISKFKIVKSMFPATAGKYAGPEN